MLRHLGEQPAAERVEAALREVIAEGTHTTYDLGGTAGTARVRRRDHRPARRDRRARVLDRRRSRERGTETRCCCATGAARGCSRGRSTASRASRIWAFVLLHVLDILLVGAQPRLYDEVLASTPARSAGCWRSLLGRGAPVPRAERPADRDHGLLAGDDPLPPAAVVRELGPVPRHRDPGRAPDHGAGLRRSSRRSGRGSSCSERPDRAAPARRAAASSSPSGTSCG